MVEIQVRTELQDHWAELSEKISDKINPEIKYGRGDEYFLEFLKGISFKIAKDESLKARLVEATAQLDSINTRVTEGVKPLIAEIIGKIAEIQEKVNENSRRLINLLRDAKEVVEEFQGENNDFSS